MYFCALKVIFCHWTIERCACIVTATIASWRLKFYDGTQSNNQPTNKPLNTLLSTICSLSSKHKEVDEVNPSSFHYPAYIGKQLRSSRTCQKRRILLRRESCLQTYELPMAGTNGTTITCVNMSLWSHYHFLECGVFNDGDDLEVTY